ncbi:MAG: shikimate dehydrogenase [Bryobacteraceae bacterium]|nr:shikimate dehydrogenase [Bryobacteraceae bacterium]
MPSRTALPRVCIALGFADPRKLLSHAKREVEAGETFLEFRLDYLETPRQGLAVIKEFLAANPDVFLLATCRRHQNHGRFNGSIDEQLAILDAAVDAGAIAIDIEIETAESAKEKVAALRSKVTVIISYHNYDGTPAVEPVLRRMTKIPADGYKLVTTARKPSDNAKVLDLAKGAKVPLILLAMSEVGFPTRVLTPAYGCLFTYASPQAAEGTATGQINARTLRSLYRFDKFTKSAKVFGVVADPVRQSISPPVHNRAFQSKRLDAIYLPFLVAPTQLKDFFHFAETMPIAGFSVTIPHKQKIIRYLDIIDPLAKRIGAVNTVWRKGGKWRGANTDAAAVVKPLAKHVRLAKSKVLVAGNGGAARGAAFALMDAGAKVTIVGRNPDRARALAKACGGESLLREQLTKDTRFDAVVHATPLGMYPKVDDCFFDGIIPADVVFDMVYNPLETALIGRAKSEKKAVVPGLEMFMEQAVGQFEIWTGESAPRAAMEKAALEALAAKRL